MADLSDFDASQVPEQQEFGALPEGQYLVIATASEEKVTAKGTGRFLQITFEVIDGPQKNRKLWARLNLWNPNQVAVDIARRELAAICLAVGIPKPGKSEALHDKPLLLTVGVELDDRSRERNVIKKYEPANAAASVGFSPAPAAKAAEPVKTPW